MVREVATPHLKVCFDARLEHGKDEEAIRKATVEVGPLQVLSHYGGEYEPGPQGIKVIGGEHCLAEVSGLLETFVPERPLPDGTGRAPVDVDDAALALLRFENGAIGSQYFPWKHLK